jgi:hypothetical protein
MKAKKFVMVSMFVLMGLVAGCHYGDDDRWSGYGYRASQRDAFRAGRAYERRREAWGSPYYYERYGYYRR